MEISPFTLLLLPLGLGLLGFIEPCTVGAHLIFLSSQETRPSRGRFIALLVFVLLRMTVMALFGIAVALLGRVLVGFQTGFWIVFGAAYLSIGLAFLTGLHRPLQRRITLAPESWRHATHPAVQGAAFGLNIPACAAPIIFGLLGIAASAGSLLAGALMMAVFALALSAPLAPLMLLPGLRERLPRLGIWMRQRRWIVGGVFLVLGVWSIWFGLFVDPANWSGR